jgi:hypothetical protein
VLIYLEFSDAERFPLVRMFCRTWPKEFDDPISDILTLGRAGEPGTRIVACNLIADHRVSKHCGSQFLTIYRRYLGGIPGVALGNALREYRAACARDPYLTFLHPENDSNFVPKAGKSRAVAHVWNLTSFFQWSVRSSDLASGTLPGFPVRLPIELDELNGAIHSFLRSGPDAWRRMIALRNMIIARADRAWHPIWAADYGDLGAIHKSGEATTWFFPLGLNLGPVNRAVVALLVYPVSDDLQLVRPTQLEATNNPHHMPSPPCVPCERGGLALRLDTGFEPELVPQSAIMVREFLHLQIPFEETWVKDVSDPADRLSVETGEFLSLRDDQLRRYRSCFGTDLKRWVNLLPKKKTLL